MLRVLALVGLLAASSGCGRNPPAPGSRPNVVLIVLDTTRPDHLSTHGAKRRTTPNLERLAQASTVYRAAHSVAPWTLPAHMSMFTGLYPGEHTANWAAFDQIEGDEPARFGRTPFTFTEGERLLARRLKEAGYTTLAVSSNPWISGDSGFAEGFDWFCDTWEPIADRGSWYAQFPDALKTTPGIDAGRAGRNLLEFKRYFASREVHEPFFAFFNFIDPHFPYRPPTEFQFQFGGDRKVAKQMMPGRIPKLERRLLAGEALIDLPRLSPFYDSELFYVDLVLGELFKWLVESGHDENTMIVVTSDHGEHLGEEGRFSHQLSVEEELLSVPLIVRYPDRRGANTVEDHPLVSNIDAYQTILSAAGAPEREFTRPHHSLDLARMAEFDREFLLAENYFSDVYLNQLRKDVPAFPIESHRVVRRAVYAAESKYLFDGATLRTTPGTNAAVGPARSEAIATWVQRYLQDIRDLDLVRFGPAAEDDGRGDSLKSLGYVGDD